MLFWAVCCIKAQEIDGGRGTFGDPEAEGELTGGGHHRDLGGGDDQRPHVVSAGAFPADAGGIEPTATEDENVGGNVGVWTSDQSRL